MSRTILTILSTAAALLPAVAAGEPVRLAGDDTTAWMLVVEGEYYQLNAVEGKDAWKKRTRPMTGGPATLTIADGQAVVTFGSGSQVRYDLKGRATRMPNAPAEFWPKGTTVLDACPAEGGPTDRVLVLVSRRPVPTTQPAPTTRPAARTQPTTATTAGPMDLELALLAVDRDGWEQLAVRRLDKPLGHGFMTTHAGTTYMYVVGDQRQFLTFSAGRWANLPLPPGLTKARPAALTRVGETIVLATYNHPKEGQLSLTPLAGGEWQPTVTVRLNDEAANWPSSDPPTVARMGETLTAAWKEGQTYRFTTLGLDGKLAANATDVMAKSRAIETVNKVWSMLFWVIPVVMVVLMLWPGQTLRTAPFALPPQVKPADVGRRVAAAMIDLLPFLVVFAVIVGRGADLENLIQQVRDGGEVPVMWTVGMIGLLVAYPLYCIILEQLYGATLGKMALHLRVVGDGGRRATPREIALRNISKVVELMVLPLLVMMLFTRYRRRLGDWIAWTAVIDVGQTSPTAGEPPAGDGPGPPDDKPAG